MSEQARARAEALAATPLVEAGVRRGFVTGTAGSIADIWRYRELLGLLVRREVKVRYKDSALGFLWSLLRPLALLLVYYIAIGKFLGAQRAIPDFAVYVFTGLTAWQVFSEIVGSGTSSIVANGGLVKKVYLPREVFPLSVVGSALFNFAIQIGILMAATALLGRFPTGSRWLYLPLSLLVLVTFATALGVMLAAVNVYLRDMQYLVEIAMLVLFWTTPVVYSWELVQSALAGNQLLQDLYLGNPAAAAVLGLQRTFWVAGDNTSLPPDLGVRLLVMLAISLVLLWISQRVFARLEGNFAQEL